MRNARAFENMHTVYGVALPKVYILVHFWQRVSASLKLDSKEGSFFKGFTPKTAVNSTQKSIID